MATKKRAARKAAASEPKPDSKELMSALRDFIRTKGAELLKDPNLSSVGIGYKQTDGKSTGELSIQFTVARKVQSDLLESLGTTPIPESFTVAGVEIPTDVIQRKFTAEFRIVAEATSSERKRRIDPIVPGVSVCHIEGTAGTIACIVYDAADGTPYILSNWHVLHSPDGEIGDTIVQPGPFDDNRTHLNGLGKLVRSHLGQAGDCAIASIDTRQFQSPIIDLAVTPDQLGEPELGDKVIKSGRTTTVTHGIVTRVDTIVKIDYGGHVGEVSVGCFEIGVDPAHPPENGEVSMGGDSGSAWLFKAANGRTTSVMAGLHFAGEGSGDPFEHAIACYPKSVFEKLQISLTPPARPQRAPGVGFATAFLTTEIGLPSLSAANQANAAQLNGSAVIDYTHFSLTLNQVRKFPFWVGWNIDGGNLRRISRNGIPFIRDPRLPAQSQAGDELYAGNRLDRGHIARRADLLWGPLGEARQANRDSFFFTNIAPQMDDFNQSSRGGIWGQLEDAVFADTDVENLRVSVFGGPVFQADDREYRGVKIPRDYWKLIAFVEGGRLKAKAFLLTQNLNQLEALELDPFRVFQVAISEIQSRTGIAFPAALHAADSVAESLRRQPESLAERKALDSLADIDWS